jgi:hypothetical protein
MQIKHNSHGRQPRSWRSFAARDGAEVERQLRAGLPPCCPWCGNTLEARPTSRLTRQLVLDARGIDLDCRDCRRFWCLVLQTPRSLRLLRMRRLAAAVRGPVASAPS